MSDITEQPEPRLIELVRQLRYEATIHFDRANARRVTQAADLIESQASELAALRSQVMELEARTTPPDELERSYISETVDFLEMFADDGEKVSLGPRASRKIAKALHHAYLSASPVTEGNGT